MIQLNRQYFPSFRMLSNIFVLIFFSILTMIMTFPLLFNINNYISGFSSTDEPSLWYLWWLKYSHFHHIASTRTDLLAVPFGIDFNFIESAFPLWIGIKKLLAIKFNEFFSYNFEILCGFILSAFFVFLLVRYLTKNIASAIISGVIFAFCPYHFVRAWQHIGLAHTQWIPLFLFAVLRLKAEVNKKTIFFAFLSLYLVFAFDLYYAYFSAIITVIIILYLWLRTKRSSFRFIFWIGLVYLANAVIFIINFFPIIKTIKFDSSPSAWGIIRPFEDLFSQSARPLSYFLPASVHPIFGKFTDGFVGSSLYGRSLTEHTLYLGWVPLILSLFAFKRWQKDRKLKIIDAGPSAQTDNFHIGFFIHLAIVAWFFSQPPWWKIGPIKILMPSFFMYKVAPMFRAYCRFGIVVMLGIAVLAGFGLRLILGGFKTQKAKIAITILFCSLVLFEFWNYPPFKVIDMNKIPAVYYWLKEQPGDFAIAEYPLDANSPSEMYRFYQTNHEKKIINGTIPGTHANNVAKAITKLSGPKTSGILKWMGVKYAFVHREDYLKTELTEEIEELNKIHQNPGLKLVKSFPEQECPQKDIMCVQKSGPIDIYEVVAEPIKPEVQEK